MVNYEETTLYDSISDSCRTVVNETLSAWYEIWVLGYDLHTGDTINNSVRKKLNKRQNNKS